MSVAELRSIRKRYPGQPSDAVAEVSLDVAPGEIVAVVGANGSGKTTSMEILTGLRNPTSGCALIDGAPVRPGGPHRLVTGVQLQDSSLPAGLKAKEAIAAKQVLYADPGPIAEVIDALGLEGHLDTTVDKLSGGWQRRLDVALACIGRPKLVVLDEPTSGVDPVGRAALWDYLRHLRNKGVAILTSTHDLSEAETFTDRLVLLHQGRVALSGPVDQVLVSAGGSWRVRVADADASTAATITEWSHRPIRSGNDLLVLGDREEMIKLAEMMENSATRAS